jgi:hypothetical protein
MRIRRRSGQARAGANRLRSSSNNNDRLAPAFQERHYDLLIGNPPSNNPNFVSTSDHQFVGRYSNSNSTDRIQRSNNIDSSSSSSSQTDWRSAFRENNHELPVDDQPSNYYPDDLPASDHRFIGRYSGDDQQHFRSSSGSGNSSFDQNESSSFAFQERHYDLLVGTPPCRNPSFVPVCGQDQGFNGQSTASSEAVAASGASSTPAMVSPMGSDGGNPFERSFVPASSTGAGVSIPGPSPYPVAAAVVVPDTEDDSAIPFVAALRIDDENENENEIETIERGCLGSRRVSDASGLMEEESDVVEATSVRPLCRPPPLVFPPRPSRTGPNAREARNRERHSRMAPVIRASAPASSTLPPWNPPVATNSGRPLPSSYFPAERRTSGPSNHETFRGSPGGGNRAGWSRVSVQARAAVGETRRSLQKKLGKESKNLSRAVKETLLREREELAKEQDALSKSIARSAKELAREQKALSRRVREEMARKQKLAIESMLPFRRR